MGDSKHTVSEALAMLGACDGAVNWARQFGTDFKAAWYACERVDWLWWLVLDAIGGAAEKADAAAIGPTRLASDYNKDIEADGRHYENHDDLRMPKACAAYRKHVKWGKHIKPWLRAEMPERQP